MSTTDIKVTVIQTPIQTGNPQANRQSCEQLMLQAEPSDLYVLPEAWDKGFLFGGSDSRCYEGWQESLHWMQDMASRQNAAVCGSMVAQDETGSPVNRCFFVTAQGILAHYDKHHLFSYGGEDTLYRAGSTRTVVEYRGWRFLLLTCYDLRFPLWARCQDDYDGIIAMANWPAGRQAAWQCLIRARAAENQATMIACNCVGQNDTGKYLGGSAIINSKGQELALAKDKPTAITARLNLEEQNAYRQKFPTLQERDFKDKMIKHIKYTEHEKART